MKVRLLLVFGLVFSGLAPGQAADKETGIAGKWATAAVRTAKKAVRQGGVSQKIIQAAGDVAGQQIPGGRSRGGRGGVGPQGRPRGVSVDTSAPKVIESGSSPDGKALIMELRVMKNKLTGSFTEFVDGKKFAIESGEVEGPTFKFATLKKVENLKIETRYRGELVDPRTIRLVRLSSNGTPIESSADGSPQWLVFERAK